MIEKYLEATIIQYLFEFGNLIKKGGDLQCQRFGITTQQWLILLHLDNDPNMPFNGKRQNGSPVLASELAEHFNVSRANITNMLSILMEKNLIVQMEDESDRRRKFLKLSDEGQRIVDTLEPERRAANLRLFSTFTQEEKRIFLRLLERCVNYLVNVLPKKS